MLTYTSLDNTHGIFYSLLYSIGTTAIPYFCLFFCVIIQNNFEVHTIEIDNSRIELKSVASDLYVNPCRVLKSVGLSKWYSRSGIA